MQMKRINNNIKPIARIIGKHLFIYFILICGFLFFTNKSANAEKTTHFEPLEIRNSKNEIVKFSVEIADTPDEHAKGLMFRENMPPYEGMLFIFDSNQVIDMWMKHTNIPLDILFIDESGVIKNIVMNTTPNSLATISSGASVIAALELNAKTTDKHHIQVDDIVLHPFFKNLKDLNVNEK